MQELVGQRHVRENDMGERDSGEGCNMGSHVSGETWKSKEMEHSALTMHNPNFSKRKGTIFQAGPNMAGSRPWA